MLGKYEILIVIIFLLITFYFVISLGAKKGTKRQSPEILSYLFGVRILIIIIGLVAFILWLFI